MTETAQTQPALTTSTATPKLNEQQRRLIHRLTEVGINTNRFLKVGDGKLHSTNKHPEGEYLDKAAFETDFQNNLYGPEDLASYPRWGICGKENLVLLDFDKQQIFDILKQRLPETFEVTSPRRGLPHRYYIVCGKQVPNLKFHIPGDTYVNAKGATVKNPSGEVRADNHYLVAPGTTIRYEEDGVWKTGEYKITKDVPLARLEFEDFMKAVQGYLMEAAGERILTDEKLFNGVSEGERHDTIYRYACRLIGDNPEGGFPKILALEILERFNNEKLFDKSGNHAPVEHEFLVRVIMQALEKAAKSSGIPSDEISELGFTVIKERINKSEIQPTANLEQKQQANTRESQADRLYKIFMAQNIELFHDQNKTEYARIPLKVYAPYATYDTSAIFNRSVDASDAKSLIHIALNEILPNKDTENSSLLVCKSTVSCVSSVKSFETVRLKDEKFKTFLSRLLYDTEEKILNNESASQIITLLKYEAAHGKCYNLYNRVASDPKDGSIWLDMTDNQNRAYHITKEGWTLETEVPILFRRYEHQRPLAEADKDGDAKLILEYVNIGANTDSVLTKHRQLLLLVQTASYLIPTIAHPINAMFGCPGSHKSTAQRFIREIFDPSAAPLLRIPRDENAALQVLDHHYIPIFDNLDYLPRWFSDMLCGAVTGAGQESRALYTDEDSFIRSFKRCVMLNGLNLPATKGDLLNRTIMHPTEPNVERKTEEALNKKYAVDLPKILGGFLDITVKALKIKDTLKATKLFRLADFSQWGAALTNALGELDEDFIAAMEENLDSQNEADIENNIVADSFLAEMNKEGLDYVGKTQNNPLELTPDGLYRLISVRAEVMGINTKGKKWPSAAQSFTRKLNDSKSAIIASGWNYEAGHDKEAKRIILIWRITPDKTKEKSEPKTIKCQKVNSQVETHKCDSPTCPNDKAILAEWKTMLESEDQQRYNAKALYFCKSCFESARVRAEADGCCFTIDEP